MRKTCVAILLYVLSSYAIASAQAQPIPERPFARQPGLFIAGRFAALASGEESVLLGLTGGAAMGRHFSFGLGVDYDSFEESRYLPLFLSLRVNTTAKKASPVVGLDFGVAMTQETSREAFLLLGGVVGIEQSTSKHFAVRFESGIRTLWLGTETVTSALAGIVLSLHPPR